VLAKPLPKSTCLSENMTTDINPRLKIKDPNSPEPGVGCTVPEAEHTDSIKREVGESPTSCGSREQAPSELSIKAQSKEEERDTLNVKDESLSRRHQGVGVTAEDKKGSGSATKVTTSETPQLKSEPRTFHFRTSERSEARSAFKEDGVQKGKQPTTTASPEFKFHARSVPKTTYEPVVLSPMERESLQRAAKVGEKKVESMDQCNDNNGAVFHSRPVPRTTYHQSIISPRDKEALERADALRRKREQEEMARRKAQVAKEETERNTVYKARPVPRTTYKPIVIVEQKPSKKKKTRRKTVSVFRARPLPKSTYAYKDPKSEPGKLKNTSHVKNKSPKSLSPSVVPRQLALSDDDGKKTSNRLELATSPAAQCSTFGKGREESSDSNGVTRSIRLFRARPVPRPTYQSTPILGSPCRVATVERNAKSTPMRKHSSSRGDKPARNSTGAFRARPIPASTYHFTSLPKNRAESPVKGCVQTAVTQMDNGQGKEMKGQHFKARQVPSTTYSAGVSPRETAASKARKSHTPPSSSPKVSAEARLDSEGPQVPCAFKARPVPKSTLTASLSPRETATSKARKSLCVRSEDDAKTDPEPSPVFKARPVPSFIREGFSPREMTASKSRNSRGEVATKAQGKSPTGSRNEPDVESPRFKARLVPKSTYSEQVVSPRETSTSKARKRHLALSIQAGQALEDAKETPLFKARSIPASTYGHKAVSPRETLTSRSRKSFAKSIPHSGGTDFEATPFKARPAPKFNSERVVRPKATLTSAARLKKAETDIKAKPKTLFVEKDAMNHTDGEFSFRARPVPNFYLRKSIPPKGTATSKVRVNQAAARRDEAEISPIFKARPVPKSMYSASFMSPRDTATSKLRKEVTRSATSEESSPNFKARPVPTTTYQYSPISSFGKVFAASIATDDDAEGSDGDDEGHTIEFEEYDQEAEEELVFDFPQEEEHTIEFDQEHSDDDISVGKLLRSVNDGTSC